MKILIKATPRNNIPDYTPEAAPYLKKDNKYYKLLAKQKAADKKTERQDRFSKFHGKRALDSEISLQIPTTNTVAPKPYIPVSSAAAAKFAVNTYISIIPDTSQRGYKSNRVYGRITAVNRSADGTYLYDVYKVIDRYVRLGVQESELEYVKGYSSNDWDGVDLGIRDGGKTGFHRFMAKEHWKKLI